MSSKVIFWIVLLCISAFALFHRILRSKYGNRFPRIRAITKKIGMIVSVFLIFLFLYGAYEIIFHVIPDVQSGEIVYRLAH